MVSSEKIALQTKTKVLIFNIKLAIPYFQILDNYNKNKIANRCQKQLFDRLLSSSQSFNVPMSPSSKNRNIAKKTKMITEI